MSDFTDIEFLEIGSKINLLANGIPAVINTKYPSSTIISVGKKNLTDVGIPFETLKYRVYKNQTVSNTSTIQVNLLTNTGAPVGENFEGVLNQNEVYDLKDFITINESSDRILIRSFDFFS